MHSLIEVTSNLLRTGGGLESIKSLMSVLSSASNLIFFQRINAFLNDEIAEFGINLLGRTMAWVGSVGIALMTIWIMIQAFRIVTGQSRDSMAALVTNSLKATLIVGVATAWGAGGGHSLFDWMGDGLQKDINLMVTGSSDDAYVNIDRSLGYMQLAFTSIDALQDGADPLVGDKKSRAMWFTGIGTGGPAITAGVMLLLNKIALALFTGLGPIFILCLLFDQTKQLFGRWLFYGIGTMFSLAVLSVMVALALDVVTAVAASFWVGKLIGGSSEGVNSMAMQQGGLGLILTMLIISAPPMAASFFQGTIGNFTAFSQFGGSAGAAPNARGAGSPPTATSAANRPVTTTAETVGGSAGGFNNLSNATYQGTLAASTVNAAGVKTAEAATRGAAVAAGTNIVQQASGGGSNQTRTIDPLNLPTPSQGVSPILTGAVNASVAENNPKPSTAPKNPGDGKV
jgi:type IV secretion system protein VirB6